MMPSRGMGAINPSKMPGKTEITRKDDPNKVAMYKRGGKVKRYNGEDESAVKEEPTLFKKISSQVASMNPPKREEAPPPPPKEAGIKPSNVVLNKDYKRLDVNASSGDIPIHKNASLSVDADASVSAAGKQKARAELNRIDAKYAYEPDANTKYGVNLSASPMGDKRVEFGLKKSWFADGGKTGLYDNINAKKKRIAAGSGEKMRKVGSKGAPTADAFKQSLKTAKR